MKTLITNAIKSVFGKKANDVFTKKGEQMIDMNTTIKRTEVRWHVLFDMALRELNCFEVRRAMQAIAIDHQCDEELTRLVVSAKEIWEVRDQLAEKGIYVAYIDKYRDFTRFLDSTDVFRFGAEALYLAGQDELAQVACIRILADYLWDKVNRGQEYWAWDDIVRDLHSAMNRMSKNEYLNIWG